MLYVLVVCAHGCAYVFVRALLSACVCVCVNVCVSVHKGIPMEEEEEALDTSIKGRLLALVQKIKGQQQKAEKEPAEMQEMAPCKELPIMA